MKAPLSEAELEYMEGERLNPPEVLRLIAEIRALREAVRPLVRMSGPNPTVAEFRRLRDLVPPSA